MRSLRYKIVVQTPTALSAEYVMSRSSRRSDSRSREPSCDWRRDPQRDRDDRKRRTRSHSRSSSPQGIGRYSRANDGVNDGSYSKHEIQDIIDRKVAEDVQIAAQKRVDEYVKSEDFLLMVETFKRREREKVLLEVQHELESERELLLSEGRKSLASTVYTGDDIGKSCATAEYSGEYFSPEARADAILLQNKLKMEEEQRRIYNEKQKEEAERLAEVLSRKHLEVSF